jgi:hypothetical protein
MTGFVEFTLSKTFRMQQVTEISEPMRVISEVKFLMTRRD